MTGSEIKAGVYEHYKGEHYLVLGLAHDANSDDLGRFIPGQGAEAEALTDRVVVVYVPLYMDDGPRMAVRDLEDFNQMLHLDSDGTWLACEGTPAVSVFDSSCGYTTHRRRFEYQGM